MKDDEMLPVPKRRFVAYRWIDKQKLDLTPQDFTCWNCPLHQRCNSAWDGWNTNGDCLEEK